MPKDAKKNVDRYKVGGGHLNEFEFHQNQGQVKDASKRSGAASGPAAKQSAAGKKSAAAKKSAGKKSRKNK